MPIVTENRLKGNYGTALVMSRLSGECLVRPVAAETDIGIDLYCETVVDGRPFLHFWLQVKAGDQCKLDVPNKAASCNFAMDHLAYWAQQPVPVFAALVPTEWPVVCEPDIYIIDVTSQLLTTTFAPGQKSATFCSDHYWLAGDRSSVQRFLSDEVPRTTARLQVSKGIVADIPTPRPQYVQTRPRVPVLAFKREIRYQLRRTVTNAIIFAMAEGEQTMEDTEFRRLLAHIVEQFGEDPHWENFFSRGISYHADKRYPEAVLMYGKARQSILADSNVRDETSWQETVQFLETLDSLARHERPLNSKELTGDYSGS